ncbi:MAG: hypothetical protein H6739_40345 [Alphaproteobacteria bacterium]|nr:hypothetical protein [Alphaproteobacteria bacterium]
MSNLLETLMKAARFSLLFLAVPLLAGDCEDNGEAVDISKVTCCLSPEGESHVAETCDPPGVLVERLVGITATPAQIEAACQSANPQRALCCTDPDTAERYATFEARCAEGHETYDTYERLPDGPTGVEIPYQDFVATCYGLTNPTGDCALPMTQALDGSQASFDFDTVARTCATAPGYTGAALTMDAPVNQAWTPGFSTGGGWLIDHSSHGDYVDDTYWNNAPLDQRITISMARGDDFVSADVTLSDPITVHRLTWPDGSTTGD